MKYSAQIPLIGVLSLVLLTGCELKEPPPALETVLENDQEKASYTLGFKFTENMMGQFGEEIDKDAFAAGVKDSLANSDSQVSAEDAANAMTVLAELKQKAQTSQAAASAATGSEFLAANAKREGVIVTDSGLQYEVLRAGDGAQPKVTDTVNTHYEGKLIDGEIFDSSYARGEPISFPLNGVISGWTEGLQLMKVGAKWRLYLPSELGYGERGTSGIPANSALIFDVELLGIEASE